MESQISEQYAIYCINITIFFVSYYKTADFKYWGGYSINVFIECQASSNETPRSVK